MILKNNKVQSGWRTVKLGEVCVSKTGTRSPAEEPNSIFKYVDITSVDNVSKQIVEPKELLGRNAPSRARQVIRAGDVLVSTTRPNLNAVALVPPELDGQIASTGFCVLRGSEEVDSEFLFSFVRTPQFVSSLTELTKGALYPAVNDKQVFSQFISLPPKDEQRRIAGRLREQMAAVERARAAVQAQLDAAQKLPAALLRAVFERGKWKWLRVDELAETCSGTTPSRGRQDFYGGKIPWVKTGELVDGVIHDTVEHITETALRETSLRLLPKNTLLIAMYGQGQTRGRTALLACEATTNQACYAILPNEKFDPKFLQLWFQFSYARLRQASEGRGGNQSNFNGKVLGAEDVPLPPVPEQRAIVARLDAELTAARALVETLETRLSEIELLPAALLRKAFTEGL